MPIFFTNIFFGKIFELLYLDYFFLMLKNSSIKQQKCQIDLGSQITA